MLPFRYFPAGHTQGPPSIKVVIPPAQAKHEPPEIEVLPMGQFTQAPPLLYCPAAQATIVQEVAPTPDVWPGGHGEQNCVPEIEEKVFAGHNVHVPPDIEVEPGPHCVHVLVVPPIEV